MTVIGLKLALHFNNARRGLPVLITARDVTVLRSLEVNQLPSLEGVT
jgi:hypothetical protein